MAVIRVEDGDVYLPAGTSRLQVLGEPEATMQSLRDALRVHIGDWFLDVTQGVDREVLVGKLSSLLPPEVEIRRVLLRVRGVTAVLRLDLRRLRSLAEAQAVDAEDEWVAAPYRVLYVDAKVTSRTAGALDLGLALPILASS